MNIEHPIISNMERTGNPEGRTYDPHNICPICGKWCDTLYLYPLINEIIGCENCVTPMSAEDYSPDPWDGDYEEDFI